MDKKSKYEYDAFIKERRISKSMLETAKFEGKEEGLEQGREQGREQGIKQGLEQGIFNTLASTAIKLRKEGFDLAFISRITGLEEDAILTILNEAGLL